MIAAVLWLLVSLTAPVVCLVYRRGWFNTPDDPDSPHGVYEKAMAARHAKWGTWWADWWWLGLRNRAQGLAYALKPSHFKRLTTYANCRIERTQRGIVRVTTVDGVNEYAVDVRFAHVLLGYRLTPIFNEVTKNRYLPPSDQIPFRPVNMDARPIVSIRAGRPD
jgi:hypothetical protein